MENGKRKSLVNTWDTEKAKKFLEEKKHLPPEDKKKQLNAFHKDIHKAEISVTYNECHSKHGIIDFKELGFSEKKATDLININIKGLVTKYKVFYFPEMFQE